MSKHSSLQPPKTTADAVHYFTTFVPIALSDGYEQLPSPDAESWEFLTPNGYRWIVRTDGSVTLQDDPPLVRRALITRNGDKRAEQNEQDDGLATCSIDDGMAEEAAIDSSTSTEKESCA